MPGRAPYLERFIHSGVYERGRMCRRRHNHSRVIPVGNYERKLKKRSCSVPIFVKSSDLEPHDKFGGDTRCWLSVDMGRDLAAAHRVAPEQSSMRACSTVAASMSHSVFISS